MENTSSVSFPDVEIFCDHLKILIYYYFLKINLRVAVDEFISRNELMFFKQVQNQ
jgi:hypothetical protein